MNSPGITELRARRAELAARLQQRLTAPDAALTELQALAEHLRLLDAALVEAAPAPPRWRGPLLTMTAAGLLVTVGAIVPMPSTPFSAEIEAESVALLLADAGTLGGTPRLNVVHVEGHGAVRTAHAPLQRALALTDEPASARAFTLEGPGLQLRQLRWSAGGMLRLEAQADGDVRLDLEADAGDAALSLEAAGPIWLDTGRSAPQTWDLGPGEQLEVVPLRAVSGRAAPLTVQLGAPVAPGPLQWSLPATEGLQLVRRDADGQGAARYVSSLVRAQLKLPATGADLQLQAGDRLTLGGLRLERLDVIADRHLSLRLSGTASVLTSAVGGFERSHLPSVLEFLARHHTLASLWTAAGFLWGILAWLQRHIGKA